MNSKNLEILKKRKISGKRIREWKNRWMTPCDTWRKENGGRGSVQGKKKRIRRTVVDFSMDKTPILKGKIYSNLYKILKGVQLVEVNAVVEFDFESNGWILIFL